ncbi:hypothetical protein [Muricoccus pecuniae]|uniref:Uncharacterized protein n=1 Tax=Muricoccus pecuniae TaxID=693023 RepID=A0A840YIQ0_9PROT|nr:hypothetical protein [Roseomonas pecuniae]MBB5696401.1 hypothetical protein [Roseomonas pecuniae]
MPSLPARNLLFLNDPARRGHLINATRTHLPEADDQRRVSRLWI